jgi:hypothetical protein
VPAAAAAAGLFLTLFSQLLITTKGELHNMIIFLNASSLDQRAASFSVPVTSP